MRHDAFLYAAGGLEGLDVQQPILEFVFARLNCGLREC